MANMQLNGISETLLTNSEPVRQTFGLADMSIVVNLLTRLYAHPIRTLTQEYISNARDANREVNSKRRIEVTAPTRFNPLMIIRDFGPGLSPERIKTTFLLYGASTKRTSNSQTGGFGIGAKSGWAYSDSFTIVTYVDGIKRTYIAHKSHGNGNLDQIPYKTTETGEKLFDEPTNESNGTEIQIASSPTDVGRFKEAILRATYFWSEHEMPVIKGIDKSEVEVKKVAFKLDNFEVVNTPSFLGTERSYIIVDGIPYPNRGYTSSTEQKNKQSFTIAIPNGKVNIAPNREELINDDVTKQFLKGVDSSIASKIKQYLDAKVSANTQLNDALREGIELYKMFNFEFRFKNYTMHYNGLSVLTKEGHTINLGNTYEYRRGNRLHRRDSLNQIDISSIDKLYYNDMPNEPATKIVWRVKKLLANVRHLNLLRNDIDQEIIDDLKPIALSTIDANDYKQFRAAKAATKKLEICLHYYEYGGLKPTQVTLATLAQKIVYDLYAENTFNTRNSSQTAEWISVVYKKGMKFAFLAKGSEHLIASNPNFIKYDDFVKQYTPTDDEVLRMVYEEINKHGSLYEIRKFTKLAKDITDKSFKYILDVLNHSFNDHGTIPKAVFNTLSDHKILKEWKKHANFLDKFEQKYPLICDINADKLKRPTIQKEVIDYVNSKV